MMKVKITKDGFVNGITNIEKGTEINVAPPIARYIVKNGNGVIVDEVKKKVVRKKAAYKTRDMKVE